MPRDVKLPEGFSLKEDDHLATLVHNHDGEKIDTFSATGADPDNIEASAANHLKQKHS